MPIVKGNFCPSLVIVHLSQATVTILYSLHLKTSVMRSHFRGHLYKASMKSSDKSSSMHTILHRIYLLDKDLLCLYHNPAVVQQAPVVNKLCLDKF